MRTSAKWWGHPGLVALAALVPVTVAAGHLRSAPSLAKHAAPSTDTEGSVSGCHVLIKWYTYRAELDYGAAQVKVKGSPYWSETVTGRSNEPWVGVERWVYFPSQSSWTKKTTVDLGYLDLCLRDGTKCNRPYYPSGQTPTLSGD